MVDRYLTPVHRSSFEQLGRLDGTGWLQFASWHFKTGLGGAARQHTTRFGYAINIFRNSQIARRALSDVKIATHWSHVAHLRAMLFRSTDAHRTLVFAFFAYRQVEVEAYYEYAGVAPASIAQLLKGTFARQRSHLATSARRLSAAIRQPATPTPIPPTETSTNTPTAVPTSTPLPPATATATSAPAPSATPTRAVPTATPPPTATSTPANVLLTEAAMQEPIYNAHKDATVIVSVTRGGQPLAGVTVFATFQFPNAVERCSSTTDATGRTSCSVNVPAEPSGTHVDVSITGVAPDGEPVSASTSFVIQ